MDALSDAVQTDVGTRELALPSMITSPFHPVQLRELGRPPSDIMSAMVNERSRSTSLTFTELASGVWEVRSPNDGPTATVLGGSHGNEPAGVYTVLHLLSSYTTGSRDLPSGRVILAIGNEAAVMKNTREIDFNLNRLFRDELPGELGIEGERSTTLKGLLFAPGSFVLDLHSTSQPSEPFVVVETQKINQVGWIPVNKVLCGQEKHFDEFLPGTAQRYAGVVGATAFTVECGQHDAPETVNVAQHAAERFLDFVQGGMSANLQDVASHDVVEFHEVVYKRDDDFRFSREFRSFDVVEQGDVIGTDASGDHVASSRCVIIFPAKPEGVKVGGDLYFLGRPIEQ